jgi:hypothetical protein
MKLTKRGYLRINNIQSDDLGLRLVNNKAAGKDFNSYM